MKSYAITKRKVSVIMPAYNAQDYIAEAINSILSQTFSDFSFIIINDGSTDKTAEIVQSYDDNRILFIENPQNIGLVNSLNLGLSYAEGEYVARMDSDDISLPQRLEKQVAFMDSNPDVGVLGTWMLVFGNRNSVTETPAVVGVIDMVYGPPVCHPTVMLRKSVLEEHALRYDCACEYCEDYDLWFRAIHFTKIANLQEVLLHYRWHDANISSVYNVVQLQNSMKVRARVLDFLSSSKKIRMFLLDEKEEIQIKLFGVIPCIAGIMWGTKKSVYKLFGFIPLLRIKRDAVYLFSFLKVAQIFRK